MKSEFSNLVARDGFLYGMDDGILACVDLATGERKWKDGRYGHSQVLLVGGVLLVQTEPGPVVLVEANPAAYREIAKINALSSKTWNVPALAGEFLLLRNDQEAVCYRLAIQHVASVAGIRKLAATDGTRMEHGSQSLIGTERGPGACQFLNKETSFANSSIYSPFINTLLQQGWRRPP